MFFHKFGECFEISYTDENGKANQRSGDFTLCALANGQYCGGGFKFAPNASLKDGLIDALLVNKVSRPKFLAIFSKFRKGEFITPDGTIQKSFKNVIEYVKCRSIEIKNTASVCADGEVEHPDVVSAECVPSCINYIA